MHRSTRFYHGPTETKVHRFLGVTYISNYIPGISQTTRGLHILRLTKRRGWALQYRWGALALFHHNTKWHLRKGKDLDRIFTKWMWENSPEMNLDGSEDDPPPVYPKDTQFAPDSPQYNYLDDDYDAGMYDYSPPKKKDGETKE